MVRSELFVFRYSSPCGDLLLGEHGGRLCLCDWCGADEPVCVKRSVVQRLNAECRWERAELIDVAVSQLDEYFGLKNDDVTAVSVREQFDVPLMLVGTPFQQRVWSALTEVPFGSTVSYGAFARSLGYERGFQAVAQAVGANPLSVILPCHRIVGGDGSLTGYSGGLDAKRWLLEWERGGLVLD